ncbi:unnamed protein product [Paramecium sonneborni]|uniref:Transmembrane protein n=1 Tax=Paramecium sonneborni TaxID=65129 RepID=A0A8S1RPG2_9CILI|nr:unnamed protein product [Paramecium sonneborni]
MLEIYALAWSYNAFLIFLIFQNESEARQLMKLGDNSLGRSVMKDMHTNDDNCKFEIVNSRQFRSLFLMALFKLVLLAFLLRDVWFFNFWQIFDNNYLGNIYYHILENGETIGNTLFVFLGLWVSKKLVIEQFNWLCRKDKSFTQWLVWHDRKYFGAAFGTWLAETIKFPYWIFLNELIMGTSQMLDGVIQIICLFWNGSTQLEIKNMQDNIDIQQYGHFSRKLLQAQNSQKTLDANKPYQISIPWIAIIIISILVQLVMRIKNKRILKVQAQ